jgi:hypothetical protein
MNQKLKRKLCAALRGGHWQQCYGVLQQDDKRCAIGVLVEILKESDPIAHWAVLVNQIPDDDLLDLIRMNDAEKLTFNQIADQIEDEPQATTQVPSCPARWPLDPVPMHTGIQRSLRGARTLRSPNRSRWKPLHPRSSRNPALRMYSYPPMEQ